MKHIWLEKENIYRSIADFIFGIVMGIMAALCLCIGNNVMLFMLFALFTVLLFFSGIMEFKIDISYDSESMNVRNVFTRYSIAYKDIRKVERLYIRTLRLGHWRWYVVTDQERISVPFPDSAENEALHDLFECMRAANPEIKWSVPV
ncbi:MAG: hypothetical protein K6G00_00215 [Treponema sp.]|nr:hypothetical protein [Treponema sp.]